MCTIQEPCKCFKDGYELGEIEGYRDGELVAEIALEDKYSTVVLIDERVINSNESLSTHLEKEFYAIINKYKDVLKKETKFNIVLRSFWDIGHGFSKSKSYQLSVDDNNGGTAVLSAEAIEWVNDIVKQIELHAIKIQGVAKLRHVQVSFIKREVNDNA